MRRRCRPRNRWQTSPGRSRSAASATLDASASGCGNTFHAPSLILASPAARTLRTAQLVAARASTIRTAPSPLERAALSRGARRRSAKSIAAQDAAIERLLVVGHNPGLTELVHEWLPSFDVDDLPTLRDRRARLRGRRRLGELRRRSGSPRLLRLPEEPGGARYGSLSGPRCRAAATSAASACRACLPSAADRTPRAARSSAARRRRSIDSALST